MKVLFLKESDSKDANMPVLSLFLLSLLDIWFKQQDKKNGDKIRQKGCGKQGSDHHTWHDKKMKHYHLFSQG